MNIGGVGVWRLTFRNREWDDRTVVLARNGADAMILGGRLGYGDVHSATCISDPYHTHDAPEKETKP